MASNTTVHHGPGLPTLLGLLFIGLKLGHVIQWSWLWVLAPFWISAVLVLLVFVVVLTFAAWVD